MCVFGMAGCASGLIGFHAPDFSIFRDGPIPENAAVWLDGGDQTQITDLIAEEARLITGETRRERLYLAMARIWSSFTYDSWLNTEAFRRTAHEIFESRILGGCSDFALAQAALFRSVGIPSRVVITANVDWMDQYRETPLAMSEGHGFVEVFLENRWHLVDSTYRWLFDGYDPENPNYPHGERFCERGKDFWEMGIRNIQSFDQRLRTKAAGYAGDFVDPRYPKDPL
jgi:transglutaminase-like putative cysteine protease